MTNEFGCGNVNKLSLKTAVEHWKINSAEFLSVEKSTKENYEFFYDRNSETKIKVSGTWKVQKLELTSSDKEVYKRESVNITNFIESLILAQDERWRRA